MPTPIHEAAVTEILKAFPGSARTGFMKSVRRAIPGAEWFGPIYAIPDAYLIEFQNKCVTIFEIEATHAVPKSKLDQYAGLWWGVDGLDWDLILIRINLRTITGITVTEIDLGDYAIETIVRHARSTNVAPDPGWQQVVAAYRSRYPTEIGR